MRSAWINGALVAAAVAVGAFTLAAFHAPTQTGPQGGSSPSPLPQVSTTVDTPGSHPVVISKKTPKPKPKPIKTPKRPHTKTKRPPVSTTPTYPSTQPTTAPQPTPSPILPTLPGGGGTQIPVPP